MSAALLVGAMLLAGCGEDAGGDSGAPVDDACADAPVITWASWGEGFLIESCQSCHSVHADDRNDAPEAVNFDTLDDVRAWSDRILAVATGDAPIMPPRGGVSDDDRQRLEIWLTCWLEAE